MNELTQHTERGEIILLHIGNIFREGELSENSVRKESLFTESIVVNSKNNY